VLVVGGSRVMLHAMMDVDYKMYLCGMVYTIMDMLIPNENFTLFSVEK
jgi:hypothetical protein